MKIISEELENFESFTSLVDQDTIKSSSKLDVKITVLGHACLFVEYDQTRLLIDPWLVGSCYWRSWWNYPEISKAKIESLKPTHIYLTHLHWDHYHGPTLRMFYKEDPIILLPKCPTTRMISDMRRDFKFSKIEEIPHSQKYSLCDSFSVYSYQFNHFIVDSAIVIEVGKTKILNANDSKVFGLSLRQIIQRHGSFDFVFRSHSSASPDPYCIDGSDPFKTARGPNDYAKDFLSFAKACKAKFAVPFASSHVFLHKETMKYNDFYNSPADVLREYQKYSIEDVKCILMPPGSCWSEQQGFNLVEHDYTQIKSHLEDYEKKVWTSLREQYEKEKNAKFNEFTFRKYFLDFSKCLWSPLLSLRFAFFVSPELEGEVKGILAIVDTKKKSVECLGPMTFKKLILSERNIDFIIRVSPLVINDCTRKKMFNTFAASKLLRVYRQGNSSAYKRFFTLVDLYENDGLPLRRILEPRQFANRLVRLREFIDFFWLIYTVKIRGLPLYRLWSDLKVKNTLEDNVG